jgi:hypothetical protein
VRVGRTLLSVLGAVTLLAVLAGCSSDESGQTTAPVTQVSIPTPTSPLPPPATQATTTTTGKKEVAPTTTSSTGGSAPCTVPDAYQNFKYTGLECSAAVTLATTWDRSAKECNTVDNPNVEAGYNRTCSVEGFTCRAKRDVHSDARFVSCNQGGQSVRFTWLPA